MKKVIATLSDPNLWSDIYILEDGNNHYLIASLSSDEQGMCISVRKKNVFTDILESLDIDTCRELKIEVLNNVERDSLLNILTDNINEHSWNNDFDAVRKYLTLYSLIAKN